MSWDELMRHSYLNYDYRSFMGEEFNGANPSKDAFKDELLLSYNE
jgi:hypothetical protein